MEDAQSKLLVVGPGGNANAESTGLVPVLSLEVKGNGEGLPSAFPKHPGGAISNLLVNGKCWETQLYIVGT